MINRPARTVVQPIESNNHKTSYPTTNSDYPFRNILIFGGSFLRSRALNQDEEFGVRSQPKTEWSPSCVNQFSRRLLFSLYSWLQTLPSRQDAVVAEGQDSRAEIRLALPVPARVLAGMVVPLRPAGVMAKRLVGAARQVPKGANLLG